MKVTVCNDRRYSAQDLPSSPSGNQLAEAVLEAARKWIEGQLERRMDCIVSQMSITGRAEVSLEELGLDPSTDGDALLIVKED